MIWALEIIICSRIWINFIVIQFINLPFIELYLEYYVLIELFQGKFTFNILLFVTHPDWEKHHVNVRYEKIIKPSTKLVIVFNVTLIRDLSQFLYWDVWKKCDAMRYVSESRNKTYLISFIRMASLLFVFVSVFAHIDFTGCVLILLWLFFSYKRSWTRTWDPEIIVVFLSK